MLTIAGLASVTAVESSRRTFITSHNRKLSVDFRVGSEMSSRTQFFLSLCSANLDVDFVLSTGHNMVAVASGIPFR